MTTQQILGTIRHFEDCIWRLRDGNAANWLTAFGVMLFCASVTTVPAQTLHTLVGFNGINGSSPQASLVQGVDGNFYSVTEYGGTNNQGTLFKMTPQGELTTLYSFCSLGSYCPDGSFPLGGLVQGTDGNFYGTATEGGGAFNTWGTIFKISSEGLLTTLHSFLFVTAVPRGTLVQGSDGNFYGTTWQGGVNSACFDGNARGCGTVFKITPDGIFTTLYSFCAQSLCTDGANPVAGLVQGSDGNFYGTTYLGGSSTTCAGGGCGTVFKITPAGGLTTLHSFCIQSGCPDGMYINAGLVLSSDGNFYGTASEGGTGTGGTVFKISPNGRFTTLYSFCSQVGCADGGLPLSALVQGHDDRLYGTTSAGGTKAAGTIFAIRSNRQLTTLYTFCSRGVYPYCLDGIAPVAALVQGSNGKFYGTTKGRTVKSCIHNDCGTIFTLDTPTSTSFTSRLNPSIYGQKVTWTATVTSSGSITPTGKVNFTWSGHSIGSATLTVVAWRLSPGPISTPTRIR